VVDAAYDEMLERVRALTERLSLGPAADNPDVASVIDEKGYRSIMQYIEIGSREGRLAAGGRGDASLSRWPTILNMD
jgi:1-pyrroline-5-carboxylate dehydrogenase